MELLTPAKRWKKCKIGYDGGLVTWISAKPTVWTPEVNYYTSGIMTEKFNIMRRTSCSSLSRVLSTRSSCFTSPTSPTSLSQDYENFIMCPATIRSDNMSEQAQGDLLQTQSQDDEQRVKPVTAWIAMRKRCNRKRIHTHFLKDRNCEMQEGQNYLDPVQETHRWSHTSEQQILGKLITAEHKVLIETCESGTNHRYAIVDQNLAA